MLISCLAFTKGISPWQLSQAIASYHMQTYFKKQLIIVNNKATITECTKIELPFSSETCIIDRPGYSNGEALSEALKISTGQVISHFPLNYYHHPQRLIKSATELLKFNAGLVSPKGHLILSENGKKSEFIHLNKIVGELSTYVRPAYMENYKIDMGAWWQYPLLAYKQQKQIVNIDEINLALKLPKHAPKATDNLGIYDWLLID